MALTDVQIERYSRQIILPGIGGRGQERLLAARVAAVGELIDLEPMLAYLVGAGVGAIDVFAVSDEARGQRLIDQMRELNPEVSVSAVSAAPPVENLTVVLIGSAESRAMAEALNREQCRGAIVSARLTEPGQIAIIPSRPPCLRCAGDGLRLFDVRGRSAELITMVAATEALKYLVSPTTSAALIDFAGLASNSAPSVGRPDCPVCAGHQLTRGNRQ